MKLINQIRQLSRRQQFLLFLSISLIALLGITTAVSLKRTQLRPRADTQLTFNMTATTPVNNETTISVFANPATGVELISFGAYIKYDPAIVHYLNKTLNPSLEGWTVSIQDILTDEYIKIVGYRSDPDFDTISTSTLLGSFTVTLASNSPTQLTFLTGVAQTGGADPSGNTVLSEGTPLNLNQPDPTIDSSQGARLYFGSPSSTNNTVVVPLLLNTNGKNVDAATVVVNMFTPSGVSFTGLTKVGSSNKTDFGAAIVSETENMVTINATVNIPSGVPSPTSSAGANNANPLDPPPVNNSAALVAELVFDKTNITVADDLTLTYVCTPMDNVDPTKCNPNATGGSVISEYGVEGQAGILTQISPILRYRLEPIITPTPTPTSVPNATATPTPNNTPAPTQTPTPTATNAPTPTPTSGAGTSQISLKLHLNACQTNNNPNRKVKIWFNTGNPIEVLLGVDFTTPRINIPTGATQITAIMPQGHLPRIQNIPISSANPNGFIDLSSEAILAGNSEGYDQNTYNDQKITTLDFAQFRLDLNSSSLISDFNCSGRVDALDYSSMIANWGLSNN